MNAERFIGLGRQELWAFQGLIKPLVPNNDVAVVAMVQLDSARVPAPLTLRQKVNSALIQMTDERPVPKEVEVSLSAEELWVIDSVLNREMGDWAETMLVKVFRALDSLALGLPIMSHEEDLERLRERDKDAQRRGNGGSEVPA